jgi:Holliday junction resolvase
MKIKEVSLLLDSAIKELLKKDIHLFEIDSNERSISFRLAHYLNDKFPTYNIDCEYNRHFKEKRNIKYINALKKTIEDTGLTVKGKEIIEAKKVLPDIIVHKRGTEDNLLIIEIKKNADSDYKSKEYDLRKLTLYTDSYNDNNLNYKYGVFIDFNTLEEKGQYSLIWFKAGSMYLSLDTLIEHEELS